VRLTRGEWAFEYTAGDNDLNALEVVFVVARLGVVVHAMREYAFARVSEAALAYNLTNT
jgi:hypothetical protein